jgi:hypothetical protein
MKRTFLALLAVPALGLGFALSSPGTDEAQADIYLPMSTVCDIGYAMVGNAFWDGDQKAVDYYYNVLIDAGCTPYG